MKEDTKQCNRCKRKLSLNNFYFITRKSGKEAGKSFYVGRCMDCEREVSKIRYETNAKVRNQRINASRKYREDNKEKLIKLRKENYANNREFLLKKTSANKE